MRNKIFNRIFLGSTLSISILLPILPANATTMVGQYHTSTSDHLNDIIKQTQLYPKGYIFYKSNDGFSYINNTLKYSLADNYLSSKGGAGNWEYSHGLNYIVKDKELFVLSSEAGGLVSSNYYKEFRDNNPLVGNPEWIKLVMDSALVTGYGKEIMDGYLFYKNESMINGFSEMIPWVDYTKAFTISNFGKNKEYFSVRYKDREDLYTVRDNRVVSIKITRSSGAFFSLSMISADFKLITPAASLLK